MVPSHDQSSLALVTVRHCLSQPPLPQTWLDDLTNHRPGLSSTLCVWSFLPLCLYGCLGASSESLTLCLSPVHTQLGTCPTNLTCCLSTSFQCYKVSCLEIPGPHGPKGYRGQKVRGLESMWPMLQEAPHLREFHNEGQLAVDDSALPGLGNLNFGFYPFPFKWYFEKSRKCLISFFKTCHLKFICEVSKQGSFLPVVWLLIDVRHPLGGLFDSRL